ncbi:TOPRIM nucleotidyl transferase/hydrolase domain-containing protein [Dactylosporangium siamense]|uniref:OLD protein-like TOPRIM domain-containing protein n=1 Tax=Dactylosporangium siamense TaxID=685454 RepID=A0A919PFJ7_9ACTN|nr:TOPRIM nucleotidyl transferase/hydrolase domain-containing protein [Dactylosporangium siamense]GIG43906.1 hypothetical protein Dsi01nite_019470 [Dactylosporangium siamense]
MAELAGYPHGPDAPPRATARALAKAGGAATLVLVEGISDQIAVETAAAARGRDLDAERVVVVPIGGAHAIGRLVPTLGPVRLAGLCDLREEGLFRRGLATASSTPLGVCVCVDDLEDELIRAVGVAGVEALFDAQGDLGSLRSMQRQPAWRDRPAPAQLRRFLGAGSRRKLRYASLLVEAAAARDALPGPLDGLLAVIASGTRRGPAAPR